MQTRQQRRSLSNSERARGEPRGADFLGLGEGARAGGPSPALSGRGRRQRIGHGGRASAVGVADLERQAMPLKRAMHSMEQAAMLRMLVQLREAAGVTQTTLAARLGITQSEVSKFERGERALDVLRLRAWLRALGVEWTLFAAVLDQVLGRLGVFVD
jgi:DNA-binding transcriptional regulator YiaG